MSGRRCRRLRAAFLRTMKQIGERVNQGPDFSHCGELIEWGDRAELDEHFPAAIAKAYNEIGFDVELTRWSKDDALAVEYERWWTKQVNAVRVHAKLSAGPRHRVTITRRTDKGDGYVKCYIRVNIRRVMAAVA